MFAVYQDGCAIFAFGETAEAAIAEAKRYMDPEEAATLEDDLHGAREASVLGEMYLAECTDALVAEVNKRGGDIAWGKLKNGTLCTEEEEGETAE